jgi:tetratricopeptide (TPR) repeat protein
MVPEPSEMLERAQACLDQLPPQIEMAEKFYAKAAQVAPSDTDVLDAVGEFHATFGDSTQARGLFLRSVELAPETNASKYFFLAQLSAGKEAVEFYRRGILVAEKSPQEEGQADRVASALVSICETYMTDLCDEPEARSVCEESLAEALRRAPDHFEAAVQTAVFHKTVGCFDAAKEWSQRAVAKLKAIGDDLDRRPPQDARTRLVETLLDLALHQDSLGVLHDLLEEDEEDVPTWYLLACAHHQESSASADDAERGEALDAASECLERAEKLVARAGGETAISWRPRLEALRQDVPHSMDED